jgi:hypothetical protein
MRAECVESLLLPLEKVAKRVDYEKHCNLGLVRKWDCYPSSLETMDIDRLLKIKEFCND